MKITIAFLSAIAFLATAGAQQAGKKSSATVPGPYPSIIKMPPAGEAGKGAPAGIIQSELSGREMQFLQDTNQTGQEQLALADLAKSKSGSEQIKAVAETLATTQMTESREIARLAATKHVTLSSESAKTLTDELMVLDGGKFEKAWIERLIAVNESGVAAYELGAKAGDAEIRSFAEKMLPVAQARLQMANRLGGRSAATTAATLAQPTPATPPVKEPALPRAIPPPNAPSASPKPTAKP